MVVNAEKVRTDKMGRIVKWSAGQKVKNGPNDRNDTKCRIGRNGEYGQFQLNDQNYLKCWGGKKSQTDQNGQNDQTGQNYQRARMSKIAKTARLVKIAEKNRKTRLSKLGQMAENV